MHSSHSIGVSRRRTVAAGLGALAALGFVGGTTVKAMHAIGGGIVGGGLAEMWDGEANVALAALHLGEPDGSDHMVFGWIVWSARTAEGGDLTLEGNEITGYKYLREAEGSREVRGFMSANGSGRHPFVMRVIDDGLPGSGRDTISLTVGGESPAGADPAAEIAFGAAFAGDAAADPATEVFSDSANARLVSGGFAVVHVGESGDHATEHGW